MFLGKTATRGTAGLYSLELLVVLDTASDLVDDLPQCDAHGHLDQTHIVDLTRKGKHLGTLRFLRTNGREPLGTFQDDHRYIGQCLNVVHVGGLAQVAALCGEGGLIGWFTPLTFHGVDQSGLLTTDKGAGTILKADVEAERGAE